MNVARINMSHGSHESAAATIALIKRARKETGVPLAILLDTKGPEVRIKTFERGEVDLKEGDGFVLTTNDVVGNGERVSISYPPLPGKVHIGDSILLSDGMIELKVEKTTATEIYTRVVDGGNLSNRKSINIPGAHLDMPYLSDADRSDIIFGIEQDVDYIALSFVRCADDVKLIKMLLSLYPAAKEIQLIAKIENREGVDNVASILDFADGVMVARGDMGVEIPFEELPGIQKAMIKLAYKQGKKVITATQMLESMITNPRPTRAEISDVANAVYDGTSAVMLSGETSVGKHPVEAVRTMSKIAVQAEAGIDYRGRFKKMDVDIKSITDTVSHSSVSASFDLHAKAIVAVSRSGFTIRKISRFRPACPIIGETTSEKAYHQLAMNWGVLPARAVDQENSDKLFSHAVAVAEKTGLVAPGDTIVIVAGVPVGQTGSTNTMKVDVVR
jgi:pyruvate kinase